MYTTVKLQCIDQTLLPVSLPKLASGGRKSVRVEFTFDPLWDGFGKTAIFYRDKNSVHHEVLTDNVCKAPWHMIFDPGVLYVGVYGSSGGVVRTSEVLALTIEQGAITGASAMEPTPDVYQQVLAAYGEAERAIAVERARINNLVSGDPADNAEVQDIRVGADGETYETAGEAVRGQSRMVGAKADHVTARTLGYIKQEPIWSQGNFSGPIETRIVTNYFMATGDVSLIVSEGYAAAVGIYTKDGDTYTLDTDKGWMAGTTGILASAGDWYRVVVRREDDTNITPDCTDAVVITEHVSGGSLRQTTEQNTAELDRLLFMFEPTRNLFTEAHAWDNATINNGVWENKAGIGEYAAVEAYMPISADTDHVISWTDGTNTNLYLYFYNADKSYLSRLTFYNTEVSGARSFVTPSSAAFFRVAAYKQGATDWRDVVMPILQIEQGTEPTAIVPGWTIKPEYQNNQMLLDMAAEEMGVNALRSGALRSQTVRSIAHRGEPRNHPQCVEPAYIAARQLGFAYAENDLALSSDGALVMWHDNDLARLGGLVDIDGRRMYTDGSAVYYHDAAASVLYTYGVNGYAVSAVDVATLTPMQGSAYSVNALPLAVLQRIDFGVYMGAAYQGTPLLTFEEWVRLCKKLGMGVYIDKKIDLDASTVAAMIDTLRRVGMLAHASWVVWSYAECELIRQHDPDARLVVIVTPDASKLASFAPLLVQGPVSFYPQGTVVTAEMCEAAHAAGYALECWHVDFESNGFSTAGAVHQETLRLIDCGVDGVALDMYTVEDAIQAYIDSY